MELAQALGPPVGGDHSATPMKKEAGVISRTGTNFQDPARNWQPQTRQMLEPGFVMNALVFRGE